MSNVKMSSNG